MDGPPGVVWVVCLLGGWWDAAEVSEDDVVCLLKADQKPERKKFGRCDDIFRGDVCVLWIWVVCTAREVSLPPSPEFPRARRVKVERLRGKVSRITTGCSVCFRSI